MGWFWRLWAENVGRRVRNVGHLKKLKKRDFGVKSLLCGHACHLTIPWTGETFLETEPPCRSVDLFPFWL